MAIDFTLAPEHEAIRTRVRDFIQGTVIPAVTRPENDAEALSRREMCIRDRVSSSVGGWIYFVRMTTVCANLSCNV